MVSDFKSWITDFILQFGFHGILYRITHRYWLSRRTNFSGSIHGWTSKRPRRGTQRRLSHEVQALTLIIHHFLLREKVPFSYNFYWKMVLLSHTYILEPSIPFNCCNSLSLKYSWIDPITRTFLRLFHSDKMHLSLFTTEISDFLTLSYTSSGEIPGYPFMYLKPEKVAHFGRSIPV